MTQNPLHLQPTQGDKDFSFGSLIIREMQIKTIVRYHLPSVRMATIKQIHKQILERVWRKGNPRALLVGMKIGIAIMEDSMEIP